MLLRLAFEAKEWGGEPHPPRDREGRIREDVKGAFGPVAGFNLDAALAQAGLFHSEDFKVRFCQYDNMPRRILEILHNLLRPGGVLLIEVPNQFFNIAKEVRYRFGRRPPAPSNPLHHLYFFSPRTLRRYALPGKFEIVELNQFRERRVQMPIWERVPKDIYRRGAECLGVGAGSSIEIYLRKSGKLKTAERDQ